MSVGAVTAMRRPADDTVFTAAELDRLAATARESFEFTGNVRDRLLAERWEEKAEAVRRQRLLPFPQDRP